jgi:hypothetical protein
LSSILKALKKIEEDTQPPQSYPSLPNLIDSKQALNSNARKRRRLRRLLYLVLILLVVAVATIFLFNQRQFIIAAIFSLVSAESPPAGDGYRSAQTKVYRAKVPTASAKPTQKPPAVTRQPRKQPNRTAPGSSDKKFQASTRSSNPRLTSAKLSPQKSSGARTPAVVPNSRVKKPLKKPPPPPGSTPVKRAAAPNASSPSTPAAGAKQPTPTRPRVTYDRVDDSKLKLQALVWSDDAARRMVVINGRIVHEGESVDGYQVTKIREEDVIVNGGGKSWRLEFGLQQ